MMTWGRRIRGTIKMALTWAAIGFLAGGIIARFPGVDSDLPLPLLFAPLGFMAGIIFSGILVAVGRGRRFDSISLPRFAGWGAAGGLLLGSVIGLGAVLRGASFWGDFLLFGVPLTLGSAACAAGSLAMAKRAERRELLAPGQVPIDGNLVEQEERELIRRSD